MNLTVDEIQANYDQLLSIIRDNFTGPKADNLLKLHEDLAERIALAPASSYKHFHSCFPGGYVVHVLNVIKFSKNMYKMWKMHGADMSGYTEEELLFAAVTHDLGKLGDETHEFYIPCESDWHIRNQGKYYEVNPLLQNMRASDRSIYLLQKWNIEMSQNEFLTIKIHDGPFESDNDYYFKVFDNDKILKNNMPFVLHQADYMAYRIEYEQWRSANSKSRYNPIKKQKVEKPVGSDKKFDELFDKLTGV